MKSQKNRIYNHLKRGKTLTALDSLKKFGCLRLAGRIKELREEGFKIKTVMTDFAFKRVGSYRMEK